MNATNDKTFIATTWRLISPGIRSQASHWMRTAAASVIPGASAWIALQRYGSRDSALDSLIERIVIVALAVIAWPLIYVLWSIFTVPWRLYCEHCSDLESICVKLQANTNELKAIKDV